MYNGQSSATAVQESSSKDNGQVAVIYENTSSQSIVAGLYTASATLMSSQIENQQIQSYLSTMKFYVGPIDGNLTSELSKKAINNFQKVWVN